MIRLRILCEGPSEESFVNKVLAPHLATCRVMVTAPLIGRPGHKGGRVSWPRLLHDLERHLSDQEVCVSTLIDFYGMDPDFPGRSTKAATTQTKYQSVCEAMRQTLFSHLPNRAQRFTPYVQMHEFEGLLFSSPEILARSMGQSGCVDELKAETKKFQTPEDINDSPSTAPSKRLLRINDRYQKVLHGTIAAKEIGLQTIRSQCPLFNAWISQLELLGCAL
jgi:hypothetical protein